MAPDIVARLDDDGLYVSRVMSDGSAGETQLILREPSGDHEGVGGDLDERARLLQLGDFRSEQRSRACLRTGREPFWALSDANRPSVGAGIPVTPHLPWAIPGDARSNRMVVAEDASVSAARSCGPV
jgi:hypothetical protein